jgi:exonuclease SbcC
VISHVEALKERIPLQVKVIPNGDGSSFVEI